MEFWEPKSLRTNVPDLSRCRCFALRLNGEYSVITREEELFCLGFGKGGEKNAGVRTRQSTPKMAMHLIFKPQKPVQLTWHILQKTNLKCTRVRTLPNIQQKCEAV